MKLRSFSLSSPLCLPVLLVLSLITVMPSCVVPGPPLEFGSIGVGVQSGYYEALPDAYAEPYYFSNNRYYYGGQWQQGRYFSGGRFHSGRYVQNGHYLYGGRYEPGHSSSNHSSQRSDGDRSRRDGDHGRR